MDKNLEITIHGKVQGVGFRYTAYLAFVDLAVQGTAENMPDGSVKINVQGPEDKLQRLVNWCHKGPEGARVESVEIIEK